MFVVPELYMEDALPLLLPPPTPMTLLGVVSIVEEDWTRPTGGVWGCCVAG